MIYHYYGNEFDGELPSKEPFTAIRSPRQLYDLLGKLWCAQTCAPRLLEHWSEENPTLGQCSITAFLTQDIFGGEVYGIPLPGGVFHCYNVVGDVVFDLTSEQFRGKPLNYQGNPLQLREVHFAREEKRLRYESLRASLLALLQEEAPPKP